MKHLTQSQPLIKETAVYFRSIEGKKQLIETLEKVSGKIEIPPPITLDKLMSVFGTTALMFPPNVPTDTTLHVGRVSTTNG
jgi:hypothetical protein